MITGILAPLWPRSRSERQTICTVHAHVFLRQSSISSLHRAEDDLVFKETTQSHHPWCFVNFSTVQIRYAQHRQEIRFYLTNDLMMYRLAELSSDQGNLPTCTSITAIESIEASLLFLGSYKSSSTQNCLGPGCFFKPVPSSARAHTA